MSQSEEGENTALTTLFDEEDKDLHKKEALTLALELKEKKTKVSNINKVANCGLETLVLDLFINDNMKFSEIAQACNIELQLRKENGDDKEYPLVYASNISNYLDKMRSRLTEMKQDAFEQATKGVKIVDKIKHLSALVGSAYERKEQIRVFSQQAFELGDSEKFFNAVAADRQNDAQLAEVCKLLAALESKVSTFVTIDYVKSLANKIVDKILNYEEIETMHRERLVLGIHQCIDLDKAEGLED